jgi:hypothetical protein
MISPKRSEPRVTPIREFFKALDAAWRPTSAGKVSLRIIGSTALMLQTDYERGTKDSDIIETTQMDATTRQLLLDLAGRDTSFHKKHRLYIEFVASALPLMPQSPNWIEAIDLNRVLTHFFVEVLETADVLVSKLKRFNANDQRDIEAMVDGQHVTHEKLVERFRLAVDWFAGDARAQDLPRYVTNLNQVERDLFDVPESDIQLPPWVDVD